MLSARSKLSAHHRCAFQTNLVSNFTRVQPRAQKYYVILTWGFFATMATADNRYARKANFTAICVIRLVVSSDLIVTISNRMVPCVNAKNLERISSFHVTGGLLIVTEGVQRSLISLSTQDCRYNGQRDTSAWSLLRRWSSFFDQKVENRELRNSTLQSQRHY